MQEPGTFRILRALAKHPLRKWKHLRPTDLNMDNNLFWVSLHRLRQRYRWKIERAKWDVDHLRIDPVQNYKIKTWFIDHWKEPGVREAALTYGFATL